MDILLRDRFTELWQRYFNNAELPITFEYTDDARGAEAEVRFAGHRCLIAQLIKARNGRTLCFTPDGVACRGGNRYLSFSERMFPGFEEFISRDASGEGERYLRMPEQVHQYITSLPVLPVRGRNLIFKRWDKLNAQDNPDGVLFFTTPDVLSGLFTLAYYDSQRPDAVIAPFGSGCCSAIFQAYREQVEGSHRAILGLFDPSARKCVKAELLTFAVPFAKFAAMVGHMEESFLSTRSWQIVQRRIK